MNLKKIFLLSFAFILVGCGKTSENNDDSAWRAISSTDLIEEEKNGMFVTPDSLRLDFLDFSTGTAIPLCDDATCTHQSSETCSAYGKTNHPFLYKNKLYWFATTEIYQTEDGYQTDLIFYKSNTNGQNQQELFRSEGAAVNEGERFILCDGILYYLETTQTYDQSFQENEPQISLKSYQLKSGKSKDYGVIESGFSSSASCVGVWGNDIYITMSYSTDNRPFMERLASYAEEQGIDTDNAVDAMDDDFMLKFASEFAYEYRTLNLENDSISTISVIPYLLSGKYYYTLEDGVLSYTDTEGNENIIDTEPVASAIMSGSYCIITSKEKNRFLWNEDTGDLYKCNPEDESVTAAYGDYVVLRQDGINLSQPYTVERIQDWAVLQ